MALSDMVLNTVLAMPYGGFGGLGNTYDQSRGAVCIHLQVDCPHIRFFSIGENLSPCLP